MLCHVFLVEARCGAFCRRLRFRAHVEGSRVPPARPASPPPAATAVPDPGDPEQVRARSGVTVGEAGLRSRTPGCRRSVPLPRIMRALCGGARVRARRRPCSQRRRRFGAGVGCGHSRLLGGKGRDGVSLVSRVSCAGACACERAYHGGAVCARDRPRARARGDGPAGGRTPPACSRRGFLGPQPLLSAEKRNGGPGSRPSLMPILHHSSESQADWEQKMTISNNFLATH